MDKSELLKMLDILMEDITQEQVQKLSKNTKKEIKNSQKYQKKKSKIL